MSGKQIPWYQNWIFDLRSLYSLCSSLIYSEELEMGLVHQNLKNVGSVFRFRVHLYLFLTLEEQEVSPHGTVQASTGCLLGGNAAEGICACASGYNPPSKHVALTLWINLYWAPQSRSTPESKQGKWQQAEKGEVKEECQNSEVTFWKAKWGWFSLS